MLISLQNKPEFFVGDNVKLCSTIRDRPLIGLKVVLQDDSYIAMRLITTLRDLGAEINSLTNVSLC